MKKMLIATLILSTLGYASYAASAMKCDGESANRFVKELQLEPERAAQLQTVLSSYSEIGKLYASNQTDKIPELIAAKEADLAAILTPEELVQFKESVGNWAKTKRFNFMSFSQHHHSQNHPQQ